MAEQLAFDTRGPRESYLLEQAEAGGTPTVTAADLEHARHGDACPICQAGDRSHQAIAETLERTEAARQVYVESLHRLAKQVPPQVRAALDRIRQAAQQAWMTDRRTEALRREANPAAALERLEQDTTTRAAAQDYLDRIKAIRTSDDGLVCDRCTRILLGTPVMDRPVLWLYQAAVDHAHRCKPDGPAGGERPC